MKRFVSPRASEYGSAISRVPTTNADQIRTSRKRKNCTTMSRTTETTKGLMNDFVPLFNASRRSPLVKNTEIRYAGRPAFASNRPSRIPSIMATSGWTMNRNRPGPLNILESLSCNGTILPPPRAMKRAPTRACTSAWLSRATGQT